MRGSGARLVLFLMAPVVVLLLVLAKQLRRLVPWHPMRSARGSVRTARGRYRAFRAEVDAERAYARRTMGQELRDDALATVFRGRPARG